MAPRTVEGDDVLARAGKVEGGVRWDVIPRVDDGRVVFTHGNVTLFSQGLQVWKPEYF